MNGDVIGDRLVTVTAGPEPLEEASENRGSKRMR